jgi:hypothetical protein
MRFEHTILSPFWPRTRRRAGPAETSKRCLRGVCGRSRMAPAIASVAAAAAACGAASTRPTTVAFQAVGPEAHSAGVGVVRPRHFAYSPTPVSYDVTASNVRWRGWGMNTTVGRGEVQFCIIMSPCYVGTFTIRLSHPQFVSCTTGNSHSGYTRVELDVSREHGGRPFTDTIRVGC